MDIIAPSIILSKIDWLIIAFLSHFNFYLCYNSLEYKNEKSLRIINSNAITGIPYLFSRYLCLGAGKKSQGYLN